MIETQVLMKVSEFYGFSRNCFLEGGLTIQGWWAVFVSWGHHFKVGVGLSFVFEIKILS